MNGVTITDVVSFNPPGGFGAFGTLQALRDEVLADGFNPPGGFGAFGTWRRISA